MMKPLSRFSVIYIGFSPVFFHSHKSFLLELISYFITTPYLSLFNGFSRHLYTPNIFHICISLPASQVNSRLESLKIASAINVVYNTESVISFSLHGHTAIYEITLHGHFFIVY